MTIGKPTFGAITAWLLLTASLTAAGQNQTDSEPTNRSGMQSVFSAEYLHSKHSDRDIDSYQVNAALGYYPWQRLGLFGQLTLAKNSGYSTDNWKPALGKMNEDTFGIGANFMARFHLIDHGPWSFFLQGSLGGVHFDKDYPTRGTKWNIMSRLGASVSYHLSSSTTIEVGYRHMHISNGKMEGGADTNPAVDSQGIALGLNYSF